jgi:hypothetical protein
MVVLAEAAAVTSGRNSTVSQHRDVIALGVTTVLDVPLDAPIPRHREDKASTRHDEGSALKDATSIDTMGCNNSPKWRLTRGRQVRLKSQNELPRFRDTGIIATTSKPGGADMLGDWSAVATFQLGCVQPHRQIRRSKTALPTYIPEENSPRGGVKGRTSAAVQKSRRDTESTYL